MRLDSQGVGRVLAIQIVAGGSEARCRFEVS